MSTVLNGQKSTTGFSKWQTILHKLNRMFKTDDSESSDVGKFISIGFAGNILAVTSALIKASK